MTETERNLELLARAYELWNAGAVDSPEFRALFHPDIVLTHPSGWSTPTPPGLVIHTAFFPTLEDAYADLPASPRPHLASD